MSARLSYRQLIGYGVGDFGINLYFISVMTYLMHFYTDVFGLSAAAAGGVFLVARVIDAVTDPLMGLLAERTRSRRGRLRPYLLFGAIPLGLITVLTFTVVDGSPTFKLWWAYCTYILFGLLYTLVTIPYATLTASLTSDSAERTRLSTVRIGFAFSGGFLVAVGTVPLVAQFDTPADGYFWVMVGFAVIATLMIWLTYWTTAEMVQPPERQKIAVADSLRAVFTNPPLLIVMVLFCGGMLSFTVRQASTVYYFSYNLGRPDLIADFFALTLGAMIVGLVTVPWLADRLGKARAIIGGSALTLIGLALMYFAPYDNITMIFVSGVVISLGATPIAVLGWAMIPDTVEYAQWRHGVRADGAIFSFASFFQKLAKALGGAAVGFALSLGHYVANQEQTADALATIHGLMTLAPAGIVLVTMIAASFYTLDRAAHARIVDELVGSE